MKLLLFLLGSSRKMVFLITLAGLLGGVFSTALIALINRALSAAEPMSSAFIAGFAAIVVARPLINASAQLLIVRFSQQVIAELRINLSRRILMAPLRHLESAGAANLMGVLIHDVQAITNGLVNLPGVAVNVAIVLGCAGYLAWLSLDAFVALLGVIALGVLGYRLLTAHAYRVFKHVRDDEAKLFEHFRALTEGTKELKLHRERREGLFDENLQPTVDSARRYGVTASGSYVLANNLVQLLFYVLIGLALFAFPRFQDVAPHVVTGYVIGLLYLIRPLEVVMDTLPHFARTMAALHKTEELNLSLASVQGDTSARMPACPPGAADRVELADVNYTYRSENSQHDFTLGPIHLSFEPGELVFVTGGNGSGKSTLAKLVTGLYPPDSGEIRVNGTRVTEATRDDYRQRFAAVFSDFYLFDSLLGARGSDLDARALAYLKQLELDDKVDIRDGVFSTTRLSQGQRKRLALLTAYLEDRPFYLFDEWAADQDPEFREVFYSTLLPELKSRNKTVVVISHDDRYYHVADRVVRLDYGQLVAA